MRRAGRMVLRGYLEYVLATTLTANSMLMKCSCFKVDLVLPDM